MQKAARLVLVGGGSGGHIVPNLAIATELKAANPSMKMFYIGSRLPLDQKLVEESGLPLKFYAIFTGKLRRYFSWKNFIDPFFILMGFFQSFFLLIYIRPQVIFSKGGYVSVPVALAGFLLRVPVMLHESDRVMGLSNRIVSRFAKKICVSFPKVGSRNEEARQRNGQVENSKMVLTGSPIRKSILNGDAKKGYDFTGFSDKKPVVLIWGGSLGAKQINDLVRKELDELVKRFQVIHITGKGKEAGLRHDHYLQMGYIDQELADVYAITDLVVGRAGANSLFELALMQKPNITIPLLINQDQLKNAAYFEENGATIIWKKGQSLVKLLGDLWLNKADYQKMQRSLQKISKPKATKAIAELILKTIRHRS